MDNFLEVRGLTKKYPEFTLNDIGFTLPKGYIMGLIGPNGSGKTTTVKLITGMISRDEGSVKIMGLDNIKDERKIKSMVGVVFDSNFFCAEWRVSEVERSVAPFYKNFDSRKYSQLLERFGISPKKHISDLSKGMQMKLSLAFAFSYDPKLLILDEPTSGLDPVSRDELRGLLSEYIEDGEHSVLFSTHITADLQKAADFITYINRGSFSIRAEQMNLWRCSALYAEGVRSLRTKCGSGL